MYIYMYIYICYTRACAYVHNPSVAGGPVFVRAPSLHLWDLMGFLGPPGALLSGSRRVR